MPFDIRAGMTTLWAIVCMWASAVWVLGFLGIWEAFAP